MKKVSRCFRRTSPGCCETVVAVYFSSTRVVTEEHFGRSKMNYCFVPSLQSMAAIKIVTELWNRGDVRALIAEWDDMDYTRHYWGNVEEKVNAKVSLLPSLPAPLREKMLNFVKPIGDQIKRWKREHVQEFRFKNMPREFHWTSLGTVDKKGTAEAFVRDPTLPEGERYGMACLYCLQWDDPVPFLNTRYYVTRWGSDEVSEYDTALREFQTYWTYDKKGDATALDSTLVRDASKTPYQRAFHCAVRWRNEVAAEYYFCRVTPGELEESLPDIHLPYDSRDFDFDFFRFLLRHTSERQQSALYEKLALAVLQSSLAWPWQQFFVDVARRVRDNLKRDDCYLLLSDIVRKIEEGYGDYRYRELFGEYWVQIPEDHKKDVMLNPYLLSDFFPFIGEKNVSIMLKDFSPEEREAILFSGGGLQTCVNLARHCEWDSLECFIGECITSHDKMIRFKQKCDEESMLLNLSFCRFLDELIEKFSKKQGWKGSGLFRAQKTVTSDISIDQV